MQQGLRLSPEETARYMEVAERMDGYADGVRAATEYVKQRTLRQIIADRPPAPNPEPPKEAQNGTE